MDRGKVDRMGMKLFLIPYFVGVHLFASFTVRSVPLKMLEDYMVVAYGRRLYGRAAGYRSPE